MQRKIETIGFILGCFAIITQFILILQNLEASLLETIIRFFSFFTILTNILITLFFAYRTFKPSATYLKIFNHKGALTALTTFILIVGLIYQIVLRGLWEPKGMQRLVDELLHTIIPLYMLMYWFIYSAKEKTTIRDVAIWLLYPITYIAFILFRGGFSNYYPYPFLNIDEIGTGKVVFNILLIVILALLIMIILVKIENRNSKIKTT